MNCKDTAKLLQAWEKILILCHASPDGDTLGSAFALARGLRSLGKAARVLCGDPIPQKFAYLWEGLRPEEFQPEHVMTVDVADLQLLGDLRETYETKIELAIDHHGVHRGFAENRWVEPDSAATAEMIWLLLGELGAERDRKTAECVYTGLTTDTGCFRYRNVTPRTHRIAAETLEAGADGGAINQLHFESKSRAQVEAERLVMESMVFVREGKCAVVRVPLSVYERTGATEAELEGVSAMPRQIRGVIFGITLKEKEDGKIKVSVRANPPGDAAVLCRMFGGGGHTGAAGCTLEGVSLDEAAERMLEGAAALGF